MIIKFAFTEYNIFLKIKLLQKKNRTFLSGNVRSIYPAFGCDAIILQVQVQVLLREQVLALLQERARALLQVPEQPVLLLQELRLQVLQLFCSLRLQETKKQQKA
ncbi:MAG: hypothetical protein BWX55_00929 [Deltaproteobacteria bacterium ADurb.Bin022]|jgi:hypothetical protein|nr:MAG: hypothetical protein BWX55_00929 [Deltaproteobacteria bacterium ADurb.Bin022]